MRYLLILSLMMISCSPAPINASDRGKELMQLSIEFLEALQDGRSTDGLAKRYAELDLDTLAASIDTEEEKLAFWINTYNAFIQHILGEDPSLFEDRGAFFSKQRVMIAGEKMSFDDIEHGIIRSSRWKLSLGYLKNPFAAKHIRMLRTDAPDGRIHFALNCGAASCPPVAIYHADRIEEELDLIAAQYLERTTQVDEEHIEVTPLMSWFRGDFGGKKGIKKDYLLHYDIVSSIDGRSIEFGNYDWTLDLGNYTRIDFDE